MRPLCTKCLTTRRVFSLNKGMLVVDRYQVPRRIRAKGGQGNRSQ